MDGHAAPQFTQKDGRSEGRFARQGLIGSSANPHSIKTLPDTDSSGGEEWRRSLLNPDLRAGVVDLYRVWLRAEEDTVRHYREVLAVDERERADRFHFPVHRNRFILGRAALRRILGRSLGRPAGEIRFVYGPQGKPEMSPSEKGVEFNVSHTEYLALIAVVPDRQVGVDVESINRQLEWNELAERFFTPAESRYLKSLTAEENRRNFFRLWTAKEAYLKAIGKGLSVGLNKVEFSITDPHLPRIMATPHDPEERNRWRLRGIPCPLGFVATVAMSGSLPEVRTWEEKLE